VENEYYLTHQLVSGGPENLPLRTLPTDTAVYAGDLAMSRHSNNTQYAILPYAIWQSYDYVWSYNKKKIENFIIIKA
jgi:hypothetical protein